MVYIKTPKTAHFPRALLSFALLVPFIAAQPGSIRAEKSSEKDFCDKVELKNVPAGMPTLMYRRRNQGWNRVDEGNPRVQLFSDALCTKVTSHHLFIPKRYWPNHPTPPVPGTARQWLAYAPAAGKVQEIRFGKNGLSWDFKDGQEVNYVAFTKDMVPTPGEGERVIPNPGGGAGPVEGGDTGFDPKDPLTAIINILRGRTDRYNFVAEMIAKFLWDEGHGFVKTDGDPLPTREAALGTIRTWVVRVMSGEADGITAEEDAAMKSLDLSVVQPKFVAALFYILAPTAPSGPPEWIKNAKDIKDVPPGSREAFQNMFVADAAKERSRRQKEQLVSCLGRYMAEDAGAGYKGCISRSSEAGPLGKNDPKWVYEWSIDAGETAEKIVRGDGFKPGDLIREIDDHEQRTPDDRGSNLPGRPDWGVGTAYNWKFLYGQWGDRNVFAVPDKDDPKKKRIIAVHLTSDRVWEGEPPKGEPVTRLTFSDITDHNNIYGQTIDIKRSGSANLMLDPDGDGFTYEVTFKNGKGGDIDLEFKRTDADVKIDLGKNTALPSIYGLSRLRAENTKKAGNIVEIGGQEFYVGGEGSYLGGAYTYYRKEMLEGNIDNWLAGPPPKAPWRLIPDYVAYINKKPGLNRRERLTSGDDLTVGKIGGKWYGNKWNRDLGIYEIAEVGEPKPKPPEPESTGTGTGTTAPGARNLSASQKCSKWAGGFSDKNPDVAPIARALGGSTNLVLCSRAEGTASGKYLVSDGASNKPVPLKGGGSGFDPKSGFSLLAGTKILKVEDDAGAVYIDMEHDIGSLAAGEFLRSAKSGTSNRGDLNIFLDILTEYGVPSGKLKGDLAALKEKNGQFSALSVSIKTPPKDQITAEFSKEGKTIVYKGYPNKFWSESIPDAQGPKGAVAVDPEKIARVAVGKGTGQTGSYEELRKERGFPKVTSINGDKPFTAKGIKVGGVESEPKNSQAMIFSFEEKDEKNPNEVLRTYYLVYFNIKGKRGEYEEQGPIKVFKSYEENPTLPPFPMKGKNPDYDKVHLAPIVITEFPVATPPERPYGQLGVTRIDQEDLGVKGAWCFIQTKPKIKSGKPLIYWGDSKEKADAACKKLK